MINVLAMTFFIAFLLDVLTSNINVALAERRLARPFCGRLINDYIIDRSIRSILVNMLNVFSTFDQAENLNEINKLIAWRRYIERRDAIRLQIYVGVGVSIY